MNDHYYAKQINKDWHVVQVYVDPMPAITTKKEPFARYYIMDQLTFDHPNKCFMAAGDIEQSQFISRHSLNRNIGDTDLSNWEKHEGIMVPIRITIC